MPKTPKVPVAADYRLWINRERTLLVRLWAHGSMEVAMRETPEHPWQPPVYLREEKL